MKNEKLNFECKLKNKSISNLRPQTENKKKIIYQENLKNINLNQKFSNNFNALLNNIQTEKNSNENQYINKNKFGAKNNNCKIKKIAEKITKIKKITKNKGNSNINCINKFNDYHSNKFKELKKQYTPVLRNENSDFQYFNFNIKDKCIYNPKDNLISDYLYKNKRSKSNNKHLFKKNIFKNMNISKDLKINQSNNFIPNNKRNTNTVLMNKNKKESLNSPKNNKSNTPMIQISPNKKKNFSMNLNSVQLEKEFINKSINKNDSNYNNNNINIQDKYIIEQNNIDIFNSNNFKVNERINAKTPPFLSYALVDYPNLECREQMEDFHDFKIISLKNYIFTYFSIFDGHTGTGVPMFLRDNYHKYLEEELKLISFTNDLESNNKKIIFSLKKSFEKIDKIIINNKNFINENGSTGTIILLYRDPNNPTIKIILCANVGDSKGYIINKNNIKQITIDHNCNNENEVSRIRGQGGIVFNKRVFGSLMLTRSFGDKEFKQYGVLSEPDCFFTSIGENDLYVVFGSDGIWDVISKEDLFELSKKKMSSKEFAQKIIITSLKKGTRDNISCYVIKLNS